MPLIDGWMESDGGPLVLMERAALPFWHGASDQGTDYEAACDIVGNLEVIQRAGHQIVVFCNDDLPMRWCPTDEPAKGYFVRWIHGDSDEEVLQAAAAITSKVNQTPIVANFASDELVLFDAAASGDDVQDEDHVTIRIEPGDYEIYTQDCVPDERTAFWIHRFHRRSSQ